MASSCSHQALIQSSLNQVFVCCSTTSNLLDKSADTGISGKQLITALMFKCHLVIFSDS